ncbi:MAG: PE-PGRS family protein, partial [Nocardioides sp.]|nr:PE-PGRS family protein [Nocardioides sp.]
VVRLLTLPVDDDAISTWLDHAAEKSGGYRVETFVGHFPDEYAESLCVLLGQLAVDAPTGDVDFEEEAMTPERLAERYAMTAAQGRETFETVALTPEGQVAAQTTLQVQNDGSDAFQWGTFVHREHRGHRLGLAVKAANLRAVQEQRPRITRVHTQNGETNGYMIDINEQIGFRPVEASVEFVRRA